MRTQVHVITTVARRRQRSEARQFAVLTGYVLGPWVLIAAVVLAVVLN